MCDYSLHAVASRAAEASEVLVSTKFPGTPTRGFTAPGEPTVAVCLRPGTELAFEENARSEGAILNRNVGAKLARFRQLNLDNPTQHHDALEFSNGTIVKVTDLVIGQRARVLQLPADPATKRDTTEHTAESELPVA